MNMHDFKMLESMDGKTKSFTILLVVTLLLVLITPFASSQTTKTVSSNYHAQYKLFDRDLFLSIQPLLYVYYSNLTHTIPRDTDYAKFITPKTVQPVADAILSLTQNSSYPEEEFADAVLSLVHQIPYNITGAKFPVETLVDNRGDCGALSILAASIMKAGGLDVVLIKYTGTDFAHMNIGVYLPYEPVYHNLLLSSTSYEYNNKTYWTAEATPEANWKVGDQSSQMGTASTEIIPLDGSEQSSPGQISCNLSAVFETSNITLNLSSQATDAQGNRSLVISGSVQPIIANGSVTIFISKNWTSTQFVTAPLSENGTYTYNWNITSDGTYYITASSIGNGTYAGADSQPVAVFIGPPSLLQFQTDSYNYIIGRAISDVATKRYMGVNNFLNVPIEQNVSFSYRFLVLPTGHEASEVGIRNVTIPASQHTIRDQGRNSRIVQIPAKTVIVPANIPPGLEPLILPDDFNQTINNQFCFTIQKDSKGNFTMNANALNQYDIKNIQANQTTSRFLNVTENIAENEWYQITTTLSQNRITSNLENENGTVLKSMSATTGQQLNMQLVMLVANNVDSAIVLKDFQVKASPSTVEPQNTQPTPITVHTPPPPIESPLPFVAVVVGLTAAMIAMGAIISVRKKLKTPDEFN